MMNFESASSEHLLGINYLGKDVFSELIYRARVSLTIGFLSDIISIVIGVTVGIFVGYFRGWTEELLMGTTDVFLLIPGLPLMIILAAYLNPSMWSIILVVGLLWWCSTARLVHSRVLQVRKMQFIESTGHSASTDMMFSLSGMIEKSWTRTTTSSSCWIWLQIARLSMTYE